MPLFITNNLRPNSAALDVRFHSPVNLLWEKQIWCENGQNTQPGSPEHPQQSPTDRLFFQIFLLGSCQKGALDSSQNVEWRAQQPAQLAGARGFWHVGSLCAPFLPLPYSFFPPYIMFTPFTSSSRGQTAGVSGAWWQASSLHGMSASPTSTGSASGHNPPWGGTHPSTLPDRHVWRPSDALEDLGGPYLAVPICTQPKTCGFCGRTLVSFTPVINFSLVISCSTYKVQLISYCLPGFEDCITEVQFCLSGVQGKKGEMKILSIFPLIVKRQSKIQICLTLWCPEMVQLSWGKKKVIKKCHLVTSVMLL